jgi:hypothetical protein
VCLRVIKRERVLELSRQIALFVVRGNDDRNGRRVFRTPHGFTAKEPKKKEQQRISGVRVKDRANREPKDDCQCHL